MLTGRCIKAPPSGELAANAVSRLRGLAVPLGKVAATNGSRRKGLSFRHPALQKGKIRLKNVNIG